MMQHVHVLLVTFPAQGHINPCLRFSERLLRMGIQVTLATANSAIPRLLKSKTEQIGLSFVSFSDDEEGYKHGTTDPDSYMVALKKGGLEGLPEIIKANAEKGEPITCLVYSLLLPWAQTVAREFHIPSALLFIQPATVLNIYYRYFNGYEDEISKNCDDPNWTIQLPGLPEMKGRDLPSFFRDSGLDVFSPALTYMGEHVKTLDSEENPRVLINTFEGLEPEALGAIEKYKMFPVGPFFPLSLCNGKNKSLGSSLVSDLYEESDYYLKWLNSQPESSVVYISFGSMLVLPKKQTEEIAKALLESGRPFLWVMRDDNKQETLSCMEKLEQQGKIVSWCSQLDVLMNPSLGCFVTHCGWNSTLESIICGVPVVAFPQWTDQTTNAKLLEDVWRTGVRVATSEDGTVESDEVHRCIEILMSDNEGGEFRRNTLKWKDLARDAMEEGGCSDMNLKAFFEEIAK
ncbi:hypothetical protein Leryth_007654 [Lithospermum erythrorhizon]|nr:hypothetical protein Leryth_007654 [Lithospermum erythrorhizon]